MARKIVVLNGSPRLKGNTALLCESFSRGAKEAGHEVQNFVLQKMKIGGCIGCMKGGKDRLSPCVIKDDMDEIYPVYEAADTIVLASPMYYWAFSAQLKAALDRLFAVAECNPDYANPIKDCVLLMAAEGASKENWKPINSYYDALLSFLKWRDLGRILVGGVLEAGAIANREELSMAYNLGASLA